MSSSLDLPPIGSDIPVCVPAPQEPASEAVASPSEQPSASTHNLLYIDVLRVVAAMAVVVIHVADRVVTTLDKATPGGWWVGNFAESGMRWAVPVFLMITGALMLAPSRTEPTATFFRRRVHRILPALLFWSVAYLAMQALLINHFHMKIQELDHFTARDVLHLLAYGVPYNHLWFFCMLPGLYLLVPCMRSWVRRVSRGQCLAVAIGILAVGGTYRCTMAYFTGGREIAWFSGFLLSGYLLLGYWLSSRSWRGVSWYPWVALFIAGATVTAVVTNSLLLDSGNDESRFVLYNPLSPSVIAMAVAAFVLALRVEWSAGSWFGSICSRLAPATMGIYLIHPMVMSPLRRTIGLTAGTFHPLFGIVATSLVIFAISYVLVWGMMRVPYLRRVVC
jgi:surface polysaccharide O-acyltransferase-like enzyme